MRFDDFARKTLVESPTASAIQAGSTVVACSRSNDDTAAMTGHERDVQTREERGKGWKLRYLQSVTLARAKQPGIDYPQPDDDRHQQIKDDEPLNVLFICSRNQWRSPTAETVWRNHPDLRVRSAGTSPNARRHVSVDDLRWAHTIFVMESKHRSRLLAEFSRVIANKPIHVLDIPDDYRYMDPELVELVRDSVSSVLGMP
jgi:predicted protein tyrosine phosphatase